MRSFAFPFFPVLIARATWTSEICHLLSARYSTFIHTSYHPHPAGGAFEERLKKR
jgi:hypothetical protein